MYDEPGANIIIAFARLSDSIRGVLLNDFPPLSRSLEQANIINTAFAPRVTRV